jgi:predicted nucleic acid-binding protein
MIALCSDWHPRQGSTAAAVSTRLTNGDLLYVAAHTSLEFISVLTKLPIRVPPQAAWRLLDVNILQRAEAVVALDAAEVLRVGQEVTRKGFAGGAVHDAAILAAARKAEVSELLTLNPRDFVRLGPEPVQIIAPQ